MTEAAESMEISLTVNGEAVRRRVPVRQHLVDFLRLEFGLTAAHLGCEHGICGACSVRLDDRVVRGCLTIAVQADGATVQTVEGLPVQEPHPILVCLLLHPGVVQPHLPASMAADRCPPLRPPRVPKHVPETRSDTRREVAHEAVLDRAVPISAARIELAEADVQGLQDVAVEFVPLDAALEVLLPDRLGDPEDPIGAVR